MNASGYAELPSFIPEHFAYSNWIVWLLAFLAARLCYVAVKKYQDYQVSQTGLLLGQAYTDNVVRLT